MRWTRARRSAVAGAILVILFVTLACGEVDEPGERAVSGGACPTGETCSSAVASGLVFRGPGFFEESTQASHLGPIIVGGEFHLGVIPGVMTDPMVPPIRIEVDDDSVFTARPIAAEPTWDRGISVVGRRPGRTRIRVLEAATGQLLDRLELTVDEISDVRIVNMGDESREELYAGRNELIGVRLLIRDGTIMTRAIDQKLVFTADTEFQPENIHWDCFGYQAPTDRSQVMFTVTTGGRTFEKVFPIVDAPASPQP